MNMQTQSVENLSAAPRACWCGNGDLEPFSPAYHRCGVCQTLVSQVTAAQDDPHVRDDERDFYGKEYWFKHQVSDLGFVDIEARSRRDLSERCLHWLRTFLRYVMPPGKVIELGGAHGGFTAMLGWAGFDAQGLELSPWVVEFACRTFGVPMLQGPIEDQAIAPGSIDAIALMDVLEHLPDPLGTMGKCLELLSDDGVLAIQTPKYVEHRTYAQMVETSDPFREQFKSNEHLYLFSESAAREMFRRLGTEHVEVEPAMFAMYDMFLFVGKRPLNRRSDEQVEQELQATSRGRLPLLWLDLDRKVKDLGQRLSAVEVDSGNRLDQIQTLTRWLKDAEADRAERLKQIMTLTEWYKQSESQRSALSNEVEALRANLARVEAKHGWSSPPRPSDGEPRGTKAEPAGQNPGD